MVLFSTDISARGLDYPDVTAVVQLGIPTNRAQYIHRVGRTGRAGKAGSGYLLLSECERPFMATITDLPVQQRAALSPVAVKALQGTLARARSAAVGDELRQACYQAWIGFYNKQFTTLQWPKEELVNHANTFARAVLGLKSPPPLEEAALRSQARCANQAVPLQPRGVRPEAMRERLLRDVGAAQNERKKQLD